MSAPAVAIPPASRMAPAALRAKLAERFPDAVPLSERIVPPLPTGLAVFDQILPNGGFPRGRLTTWSSPSAGATALLRVATLSTVQRGERSAWIDGQQTLGPGWEDGPLVVRPHTPDLVRKAAEILAKSGAFPLVVVTGLEADQATMLRLSRMVHEGGGALIALTSNTISASLRLSSRYLPHLFRMTAGLFGPAAIESVAIQVGARTPGWQATTIIHCPITQYDFRLALDPALADRRGTLD